jgi:hypothetical protein
MSRNGTRPRPMPSNKTIRKHNYFHRYSFYFFEPFFFARRFSQIRKQELQMHPMHTAPKTGELLLLIISDYDDNDWCVVGFYHRQHGWISAADSTRIRPIGWERHHLVLDQYPRHDQFEHA